MIRAFFVKDLRLVSRGGTPLPGVASLRRAAKPDAADDGDADVWNGPVPSFLGVSAL